METIWANVKSAIKGQLPDHSYQMWIEALDIGPVKETHMIIHCPNHFSRKRVQETYGPLIASEIQRNTGVAYSLQFEVNKKEKDESTLPAFQNPFIPETPPPARPAARQLNQMNLPNFSFKPHAGRMLRRDFTFDSFVVGGNNDFAYSAALSMAAAKTNGQNTLYLLANTGLGKSHLSQAVGHHILCGRPQERVFYITAEDFTNEMVHAFRHDTLDQFKQKFRAQCDVLLLEDVHFLTGKERTQIELSQVLDYLWESRKKIIFTSCHAPAEIPKLSGQLRSRLTNGLVSNIDPPDFSTRVRILRKKIKENHCQVPRDVIEYLASELTENVRQLESGLIGVTAKSSLLGTPIDLQLAESVVKNIVSRKKNVTIEVIKKMVCKNFSISVKDMISKSRKQQIVRPRQIAIYLSRRYTDQPLQAIGRSFNRQHATAIHAINAVEQELKVNGPMKRQVEYLCAQLESGKF